MTSRNSIRALVLALALVPVVAGCAGSQGGGPSTGDTRFVPGDGKMSVFTADARKPAPKVEGTSLDDGPISLAAYRGKIVVLNFWASWCAPCVAEAPVLKDVAAATKADGVEFLGVAFKDDKAAAKAFERNHQPGYPSLYDQPGKVALAFQGTVPPAAIPATLIIDREGRIAARALGAVKYTDLLNAVKTVGNERRAG
ncbi:TlpA disulfide reductase family protein [Spongiactinospora sp. TRM90649]|uniref:TlpA family protein disulfide reductase n=1 Tax=Spongiactinospora sp. TRM90649 TaxID=3031114 RepID=UPI0023FA13C1|nr:TlpA disulfide reductase family protein [Spongiactinospora sp. TRM90649]MDF5754951.1 TlpA disulfide reductase family protein [Spongiactinospora sp. TRM90649]